MSRNHQAFLTLVANHLTAMFAFSIVIALSSPCSGEEVDVSIEDIKRTWAERKQRIASFEYRCDVTEERAESSLADPFGSQDEEVYDLRLSTRLVFKLKKDEVAFSIEGDWPHSSRPGEITPACKFQASFDGKENRDLLSVPKRAIPHQGSFQRRGTPRFPIAASDSTTAIWMWFDPIGHLKVTGYEVERLTLSTETKDSGGGDHLLVTAPRGNWTAEVLVKSTPPFLPARLSLIYKGEVRMLLTMEHAGKSAGEHSLASWQQTQTTDKGSVQSVRTGVVKEYLPNKIFNDAEFVLKFPVGAHLLEFTGDKDARIYWIQANEREMKRIDRKEYGRAKDLKVSIRGFTHARGLRTSL